MITVTMPEARDLEERDVQAILARNITGRIAFLYEGEIEIRPIRYTYGDGSIYLRSAPDAALSAVDPEGARVGFEVDEIHTTQRWRSVVVRGTLFRIRREEEMEEWMRALGRLRRFVPNAFRLGDNVPERSEIFRLVIRSATGRAMG